ncbi:MAG: calcium-translocating P-type ATPase, PMCA-type [Bacilli bacterium]
MNYYTKSKEEVIELCNSDEKGLTTEEALQRNQKYGLNKLKEAKKDSLLKKIISQLMDPMVLILIIAAIVSLIISLIEEHKVGTDVFVIIFVVLLNTILGVAQEANAEKAIDSLKKMTSATSKVLRNNELVLVHSSELTIGDVVIVEAGDLIPADGRIMESASLQIEEAALTGESLPVYKTEEVINVEDCPLGDRKNMAFMGSTCVYGRGKMIVTSIGMDTEMGKIATSINEVQNEETPLQKRLNQLSKILTFLVIGICIIVFIASLIRNGSINLTGVIDSFMVSVSLAVAAIPEGLSAIVTIVLSLGVTKMSKKKAIIRKLSVVETLGCTQVICSDKTGTLTQNKMTVVDYYTNNFDLLIKAMALCSDACLNNEGVIGEPTEVALVEFAKNNNCLKNKEEELTPRINEIPFDSIRKKMTTFHQDGNGTITSYTKGAPDEVINNCSFYLDKKGSVVPLTKKIKDEILKKNKEYASKALRVLGVAYKEDVKMDKEVIPSNYEKDLIFIGLECMKDPLRDEVKDAVKSCEGAGINVIMITGDHKDTAVAIGKELGIINSEKEALTGVDLEKMSEKDLQDNISSYHVFARVQPEHKVRIVDALKKQGNIVAMTGDGVNDAPSLKKADIGVGMGITGTEVTKNCADMILADDNFSTIVVAVEEGRKIYDNIVKVIQFLLSTNISEVVAVFIATLIGFTILKPTHILWINLITDSLPALALALEKGEDDIMKKKPRPSNESLFAHGLAIDIFLQGLMVGLLTLTSYLLSTHVFGLSENEAMTMAFLTLSSTEIFQALNMRSSKKSIFELHYLNYYLLGTMVLSFILSVIVIYVPFINHLFDFMPLDFKMFMIGIGLGFTIIPLVEIYKLIKKLIYKNK